MGRSRCRGGGADRCSRSGLAWLVPGRDAEEDGVGAVPEMPKLRYGIDVFHLSLSDSSQTVFHHVRCDQVIR